MTDTQSSKEDFRKLLASVRSDFIDSYGTREKLHTLKAPPSLAKADPSDELEKLAKMIKAHATKVGIVCNPGKFDTNVSVALKEFQLFSNAIFYLLSLTSLFYQGKHADYLVDDLDASILGLLNGVQDLCTDVTSLLDGKGLGSTTPTEADTRLTGVGKIWSTCDNLEQIAIKGNFGLLNGRISVSLKLINDSLSEVDEWLMEPELCEEDPFGLCDESDDELAAEKVEEQTEVPQGMIDFVQIWQKRLKLIKLLLSSFSKSISSNDYKNKQSDASKLSKLNVLHKSVVEQIDELISTVFMSGSSFDAEDEEIKEITDNLVTSLKRIVNIIKVLNKNDEKRGKWVEVWETNFFAQV
ncbi:LAMI_0G06216g1_1 [Lachancea mirantina]|uniref:LAMI_0G06216g1_1 n=1 Tax=Lachancea mirantina TaxID=1230905 RepID=A0A1G4K948_9SACH|nr:LAMI_0G06216g1_1 [Lachancea mirantina]